MRVLIVGGDSKVGSALYTTFKADGGHDVDRTSRRVKEGSSEGWYHLDLLKPILPARSWDIMYIVAAVTGFGPCEALPANAWRVNADAPVQLALCAQSRIPAIVFVSSDAVATASGTAYGRQKAHAELGVLATGGVVVRPSRIDPEHREAFARVLVDVGTRKFKGQLLREEAIVRWSAKEGCL